MSGHAAPTVLVVEDDAGVRTLIETVLEAAGCRVISARDGLEGLVKLRGHEPAVLVLDIMMPDVGGLRVLDELAEEHADVEVVVVTGKPDAAQAARDRLGDASVFAKPFDIDELADRVTALATKEGKDE